MNDPATTAGNSAQTPAPATEAVFRVRVADQIGAELHTEPEQAEVQAIADELVEDEAPRIKSRRLGEMGRWAAIAGVPALVATTRQGCRIWRGSWVDPACPGALSEGFTVSRKAIRRMLAALLGLAASLPAVAQVPSLLCAALYDSSGVDGGASVADCDLDGRQIQKELTTATFGQYTGDARAASSDFGNVSLLARAQFVDYGPRVYVPAPWGINFAASADARFTDFLGVLAPAYPELRLVFRFELSGSLSPPAIAAAQLCHGLAYGAPPGPGTCTIDLPATLELLSEPFVPDGSLHELAFFFSAVVFINDEWVPGPYTTAASADLEHTVNFSQLLATQLDGTPARGVSLTSGYGIDYPLAPVNQLPVPEPTTWATLLAGLAMLGWRRRFADARSQG